MRRLGKHVVYYRPTESDNLSWQRFLKFRGNFMIFSWNKPQSLTLIWFFLHFKTFIWSWYSSAKQNQYATRKNVVLITLWGATAQLVLTDWRLDDRGSIPVTTCRLTLTCPPIQRVPWALFPVVKRPKCDTDQSFYVVSRLGICGDTQRIF